LASFRETAKPLGLSIGDGLDAVLRSGCVANNPLVSFETGRINGVELFLLDDGPRDGGIDDGVGTIEVAWPGMRIL